MQKDRGFTLIEILVVLVILGVIATLGLPRLMKKDPNIKSVVRQFLVLSKEIRNQAKLSNSTYRLAVDMGDNPQSPQTYWVEHTSGPKPIDTEKLYENKSDKSDKDSPPADFQLDKRLSKKPKSLPKGLFFAELETVNSKSTITSGMGYIHFFPEGFVEAATLQITDRKKIIWTLVFNPLTGQADIVQKAQSLKGLQR
ncbi:MAG: pilus assembly FimT family protein [Pseudobdellovibrionaceae bacterium]